MFVVDTSVVVDTFLDEATAAAYKRLILSQPAMAPDHIYAEVLHALRRLERQGVISSMFAEHCVTALEEMNLQTHSLKSLIQEAWLLRHNITPYDAPFVVLAGELDCPLITHDEKLARVALDHIVVRRLL
jgi:predicted nucleic acid-binding protein